MIKVGIVGVRGLSTLMGFQAMEGVQITALCDLDEELLKEKSLEHGIPNTYRVYEDMLASGVDAVVIATPMQCHVPQAILALRADIHVLSEVTAGVTMDELFWLTESVQKSKAIYMMAENYNYIPQNQQLNNMVAAGLFGNVYFAEGEYVHDIRSMTHDAHGKPTWRNHWQLGKRGAFYPTHSLGPTMQWFRGDRIEEIACFGTQGFSGYGFRQDDTTLTMVRLASGKLIKIRVDCLSNRPHGMAYYALQGDKGCYEAPRGLGDAHKVWVDRGDQAEPTWQPLSDFSQYLPDRYLHATEQQKTAGHGGGDYFIVKDFVDAIGGAPIAIDIYDACEWTAVALLSEISITNGGKAMRMPDFRKIKACDPLIQI